MGNYDDIIHRDRPEDLKHPRMSLHNRAAQFAPFDALTGFGGRVYEASRLTQKRIEITEEVKQGIDAVLQRIAAQLREPPLIRLTFFIPDKTKEGGSYETVTSLVTRINSYDQRLKLKNPYDPIEDDLSIAFEDILEIEILETASEK